MRTFISLVAIVATMIGYPAFAEDVASPQPTRIEINQEAKAFIFVVDNKPVALLDESGLTVREGIVYGATLTDAGTVHFDKQIERLQTEAADE